MMTIMMIDHKDDDYNVDGYILYVFNCSRYV